MGVIVDAGLLVPLEVVGCRPEGLRRPGNALAVQNQTLTGGQRHRAALR